MLSTAALTTPIIVQVGLGDGVGTMVTGVTTIHGGTATTTVTLATGVQVGATMVMDMDTATEVPTTTVTNV